MTATSEATQAFIAAHADDDVRQLALRHAGTPGVDLPFALDQIAGRQQARRKLPTWAAAEGIVYPPHLSMEQCSSEQTARYKARVVERLLAERDLMVDLTGGLGVDFSFVAPLFRRAAYVERNAQLCAISSSNLPRFVPFASYVCASAEAFLPTIAHASLLFLDPARRNEHGARTFAISDCTPDVLSLRDELLRRADVVMLKLSPMLDWRKAVSDLGADCVSEVHIVSVHHECKELLVVMSSSPSAPAGEGRLVCVDDDTVFETSLLATGPAGGPFCLADACRGYLYEPNASVMKAGCFGALAARYAVTPLSANSHLFVSDRLIDGFPGRRFQILSVSSLNKRELKARLGTLKKANLTVRNFPLTVAELRKRLRLAEGGTDYLFATTLADGSHVLIATVRIN